MSDNVVILDTQVLSKNWYTLRKFTFRYLQRNGTWVQQEREAYDRGNGAVVLPYNRNNRSVVLIRQFRLPSYLNGNKDGMLIEACAGLLDLDNPEACIRKEAEEEIGFELGEIKKIFDCYMSPGSVTEMLHFFVAEYDGSMRRGAGGGVSGEEDIEVIELPFEEAQRMIQDGRIKDAKTIMLLQYLQCHSVFDR